MSFRWSLKGFVHQVDTTGLQWRFRQLLMVRFDTAPCSSHPKASRRLESAVCDEDLLFKNACGRSVYRPSPGWGWSATSLYLTSWVISPSQRRFRALLIWSIMGIRKDGVSLSTDGRGPGFHREGGVQVFRGSGEGPDGVLEVMNTSVTHVAEHFCSDKTCAALLLPSLLRHVNIISVLTTKREEERESKADRSGTQTGRPSREKRERGGSSKTSPVTMVTRFLSPPTCEC